MKSLPDLTPIFCPIMAEFWKFFNCWGAGLQPLSPLCSKPMECMVLFIGFYLFCVASKYSVGHLKFQDLYLLKNFSDEDVNLICCVCKQGYNGSHKCKKCKLPCHAIEPCIGSKTNEEEEGYGAEVICRNCTPQKIDPMRKDVSCKFTQNVFVFVMPCCLLNVHCTLACPIKTARFRGW